MFAYPTTPFDSISEHAYTHIVFGGGTAGCVVAVRLSEILDRTVFLLEHWPVVGGWAASVPLLSSNFKALRAPAYEWESAPLTAINEGGADKRFKMVVGQVLGGSARTNGLVYTRSVPGEYNS